MFIERLDRILEDINNENIIRPREVRILYLLTLQVRDRIDEINTRWEHITTDTNFSQRTTFRDRIANSSSDIDSMLETLYTFYSRVEISEKYTSIASTKIGSTVKQLVPFKFYENKIVDDIKYWNSPAMPIIADESYGSIISPLKMRNKPSNFRFYSNLSTIYNLSLLSQPSYIKALAETATASADNGNHLAGVIGEVVDAVDDAVEEIAAVANQVDVLATETSAVAEETEGVAERIAEVANVTAGVANVTENVATQIARLRRSIARRLDESDDTAISTQLARLNEALTGISSSNGDAYGFLPENGDSIEGLLSVVLALLEEGFIVDGPPPGGVDPYGEYWP
jgi:methyl-accepting chemotaxis protein